MVQNYLLHFQSVDDIKQYAAIINTIPFKGYVLVKDQYINAFDLLSLCDFIGTEPIILSVYEIQSKNKPILSKMLKPLKIT